MALPALIPVIVMFGAAVAIIAVAVGRNVSATDPAKRGTRTRNPGRMPPLPRGCRGTEWRLIEKRPAAGQPEHADAEKRQDPVADPDFP